MQEKEVLQVQKEEDADLLEQQESNDGRMEMVASRSRTTSSCKRGGLVVWRTKTMLASTTRVTMMFGNRRKF